MIHIADKAREISLVTLVLIVSSGAFIGIIRASDFGVITVGSGEEASVDGSIIAFSTMESSIGQDLNGDGDIFDSVIRYYNTSDGNLTNTGLEGTFCSVAGSIIAFQTWESWNLEDLNGDLDTDDVLISYYNISDGAVTAVSDGLYPSVDGSIIAFQGEHVMYYNISDGTINDTGEPGWLDLSVSGSIIAFSTMESSISQDLNGDGDIFDSVIRFYNMSDGTVTNTGESADCPSISGSIIAFSATEYFTDQDLNGDGDKYDDVVMYHNISDGSTTNTGTDRSIGTDGVYPSLSGSIIAFQTWESFTHEDLNGDGIINGFVIRYYNISSRTVTNTDAYGKFPEISGSTIAFQQGETTITYFTIDPATRDSAPQP